MRNSAMTIWAIGILAMYMTLLSSYAVNTYPDLGKRRVLQRVFAIGFFIFCAMIIWNRFNLEVFLRSIL